MDQRAAPKVSVVVASYSPGDAVNRVIDSLDAQTLAQDEFEVIFVDDGSPDDTFEQLRRIAATRSNMQVFQIPNSGWPSRPRNVGLTHATGEYLLFMDHDDSIYPDGLRRAYEYAHENDADILSPKESKTNDSWWGMSSLTAGNIPNALLEQGIDRMLPMVPHKLYRRQMFLDHDIRFPEGSRVLWEDWFINIDAYRHAKVISILADSPVYLWHASDTNSSHTFSPARVDFWDRLDDMMTHITVALAGPDFDEARTSMLMHQVRIRVVERCVRLIARTDPRSQKAASMALPRAQELLERFASEEVMARLPKRHRALVHLMRGGDKNLITAFHEADLALTGQVAVGSVRWDDGVLRLDAEARWEPQNADAAGFRLVGGRVIWDLDPELTDALPPELVDVTDDASDLAVSLNIRSRAEHVSWALPYTAGEATFQTNKYGSLSLVQRGGSEIELGAAALGQRLDDTVWDVRARTDWIGLGRAAQLVYRGPVLPALQRGRAAVVYASAAKGLTLDLAQRMRTLAIDAHPWKGPAGVVESFSAPLMNVVVFGETELDAGMVVAIPADAVVTDLPPDEIAPMSEKLAAQGDLGGRIIGDAGGARFEGSASLPEGRYVLYARRTGTLYRTQRSLIVGPQGQVEFA